nr:hypothetical protein [Tanacetum cinerariifolium]
HDDSSYAVLGQLDSDEESEKVVLGATEGGNDEDQAGPDPGAQAEGQTRTNAGILDEGQAGSNPNEMSEGQAGPDPSNTRNEEQSIPMLGQSNSEEESEKIVLGVEKGGQDEVQNGPDPDVQAEDQTGSDAGAQAEGQARSNPDETPEGQAGSNPDETSEDQAGPDPGNAKARVQSTSSLVVHAGSDREHMDLDVANVHLNLLRSNYTKGLLQRSIRIDFSFGDQFFSDKHLDANKSAETEVESMVNVTIQQALSSISLMTSPIIDLTSRPEFLL